MPAKSGVDWCDYMWNGVTGCTRVNAQCDRCYALTISNRAKRHQRYANTTETNWKGRLDWTGDVFTYPALLDQIDRYPSGAIVFMAGMSDLFHRGVDWNFTLATFQKMRARPDVYFLLLTKRPGRLLYFWQQILSPIYGRWPENVWAGVSIGEAKYLPWLDLLAKIPAKVLWASFEPLLEPLWVVPWLPCTCTRADPQQIIEAYQMFPPDLPAPFDTICSLCGGRWHSNRLSWAVIGGESGPGARPCDPVWVRELVQQCQNAGVAVYFKQWGGNLPTGQTDAAGVYHAEDYSTLGFLRMTKAAAGHSLDGCEYREYPVPGLAERKI